MKGDFLGIVFSFCCLKESAKFGGEFIRGNELGPMD